MQSPTASFYQYDGRGTVRMLTNAAGAVTDTYEYDAFGNLIASTGTTPNFYLYRGERYDADLGLYYLRARWFNPVSGRFMTRDPYAGSIYDPASLHRYNYARSNPANFIDPSGRAAAADYALNLSNFTAKTATVTAFGEMINCGYFALASDVWLVGQHLDQQITQLKLLWTQCAGQITAKQFMADFLLNATVGLAFEGVGALLEDGAQGAPTVRASLPRWAQNFRNGREFEKAGLKYLETVQTDVADQVSIRPYVNASGDLADFRVRVDAMGLDSDGNLQLTDFKSSDTAGFTPNQSVGYPLLEEYGGEVVGQNGNPFYPPGFAIPPSPVTIIMPGNIP